MTDTRKPVQISEPSFWLLKGLQQHLRNHDSITMSLGNTVRRLVDSEIRRRIADGTLEQKPKPTKGDRNGSGNSTETGE